MKLIEWFCLYREECQTGLYLDIWSTAAKKGCRMAAVTQLLMQIEGIEYA